MLGLRTQEGEKFERFFSRVQSEASKEGKVFFLDFADGDEMEKGNEIVDDLFGWLIPEEKADTFDKLFMGNHSLDKWSDYSIWAVVDKDTLKIEFKHYG